jgi:hypothetical protein
MRISLLVLLLVATSYDVVDAMTLTRVRYCTSVFLGACTSSSAPLYTHWDAAGVPVAMQRSTYVGVVNQPADGAVRYIALFSAGQQSYGPMSTTLNVVTGQPNGYASLFTAADQWHATVSLDARSMAGKFVSDVSDFWPLGDTLVVVVADAHLDAESDASNVLAAFDGWLGSLIGDAWSRVEGVYLAGYSHGGCFVNRLAQRLQAAHGAALLASPNGGARFVVQGLDPVARADTGEFGTSGPLLDNPLVSDPTYAAYRTHTAAQFSSVWRARMCICNLVGGQEVEWDAAVHAYSDADAVTTFDGGDLVLFEGANAWYRQSWTTLCHACIGRSYTAADRTIAPMLAHFTACKQQLWGSTSV